ncbi:hypothetical protein [Bradyrhizobium sp. JR18.2]|uniref:hypothetical protein n=1 Tax=Bradyrhizobium sp. JR18.2 TaxID=3156369 RepID=UPI0033970DA6
MNDPIEMESLVGEHVLDACDLFADDIKASWGDSFEHCELIRFRLDGKVYTGIESPDDGYRSSLRGLYVSDDAMKNVFPPVRVLAKMKGAETYQTNDTLQLIDMVTGKIVLEVGTDNTDDYYPWFVGCFFPDCMATNATTSQ